MQDSNYGKDGTTQGARNEGSKLKSQPGCVGTFSRIGAGLGTHQVGTGRENSYGTDTSILRGQSIERLAGKLVGQLINETEKQLAYHDQQSQLLKSRLQELQQLSEIKSTE